ncbi:MAG: SRPBCC domain-containing protein [Hyphomicrobiales bacterium]
MQAEDRYGTLEEREDGWLVTFVRELNHPQEKVWRAITEPEHLEKWFPSTIDGERRAGARLTFRFPDDVGGMVIEGEMVAFELQHLMELLWGGDRLRIELTPRGSGTRLVLKALMQELGKTARDGAGWHTCLEWLEYALDDRPRDDEVNEIWRRLERVYAERFGPEAATIGPPEGAQTTG